MSLLSELIAQLRALIDHSNDTMTSVRSARDVVEMTTTALQTALSDSSHSAVHEGFAHWQTALEKLDEAQALLLAGDVAMDSYITGPLLGGSTGPATGVCAPPVFPERFYLGFQGSQKGTRFVCLSGSTHLS